MKANEFKAVIRQVVIEEVKREVSNQLPKLLFEMLGQKPNTITSQPLVRENVDETSIPKKIQTPSNKLLQTETQKKVVKKYAKDPVLNAILNETTPGLSQSVIDTGVPIPNFNKVGVSQEFIGEMKEILNESQNTVVHDRIEETVEEIQPSVGPDLSKLFNKNFKAILDQSKKGHAGNFSKTIQSW